jgi:hypothetical protein
MDVNGKTHLFASPIIPRPSVRHASLFGGISLNLQVKGTSGAEGMNKNLGNL